MKGSLIGAGLLASLGAMILLIAAFAGRVSPRDDIADDYKKVSDRTYSSEKAPLAVAGEIVRKNETDERVYTPNGIYLRYYNAVVGILPNAGGSRITVDTPERGYARYHAVVGGNWGGPGGRASSFRGGGPGGGGK
ncbi:DUF4247 domain-containing protein [Actinomadura sp. KC345]|uniref:DUF4247 domain-containing protein n=1 Tax=Actinomadura sp. KC345 TaxID=2530371 RepID=UPI00104E6FEF|nr:DUF4247 domain-containing protein [Actinomadura sp. KC345]TDC46328.1 DUF4247 domain-containing protein [Actinomadura sp. KC345]